ncbi:MAG: hypothetical protein R6V04_09985 [bacterium]
MDKQLYRVKLLYIIITLVLLFFVCKQKDSTYLKGEEAIKNISLSDKPTGQLVDQGYKVVCSNLKNISLSLHGKAKMVNSGMIRAMNDTIYIIDRNFPEIKVFTTAGKYIRDIYVEPKHKIGFDFVDFMILPDDRLFIKNSRQQEIIIANLKGDVLHRIDFSISKNEFESLAFTGMSFCCIDGTEKLFSGLVQHNKDIFEEAFNVVIMDVAKRVVENRIIKRSKLMKKYNLTNFQPFSFTVYNQNIYFLEQPLPYIRVFNMSGDYIKTFGVPGKHMRPIEKQPRMEGDIEKISTFIKKHTLYDDILLLEGISNEISRAFLIVYYNFNVENSIFGILYDSKDKLLFNDISLPGYPCDVIDGNKILFRVNRMNNRIDLAIGTIKIIKKDD